MMKRLLNVGLLASMSLLVACGGGKEKDGNADPNGTTVDAANNAQDGGPNGDDAENVSTADAGLDMPSPNNIAPDMGVLDGGPKDAGSDGAGPDASDDAGGDMAPDAGDMGPDMSGPCDRNGLNSVIESVSWDGAGNFLVSAYNNTPGGQNMYDFLSFEIYPDFGGMVGPQMYDFPGQNYEDCNTCLLIFADCMSPGGCDKIFLVDTGSVDVVQASTANGAPFQASFSNLQFSEVRINTMTFRSTPVNNGETYCIDSLDVTGITVAN